MSEKQTKMKYTAVLAIAIMLVAIAMLAVISVVDTSAGASLNSPNAYPGQTEYVRDCNYYGYPDPDCTTPETLPKPRPTKTMIPVPTLEKH